MPRRKIVPIPLPLPPDFQALLELWREQDKWGHLKFAAAQEAVRAHIGSYYLKKFHNIDAMRIDRVHGSDAEQIVAGIKTGNIEFKATQFRPTQWCYGDLSIDKLNRHLEETHIWKRFVKGPDGFDRLVDMYAFPPGSKLHDFFWLEREYLLWGGQVRRVSFGFKWVKEFGGVSLTEVLAEAA